MHAALARMGKGNPVDRNSRICIVGGGPAGLSLAMYLEKNGFDHYTIFERSGRVGGKAFSPLMKVKNSKGEWEDRTIEMGAVMGCDTYFAVHECEEFGHTSHADGPLMGRRFMNTDGTPRRGTRPLRGTMSFSTDEAGAHRGREPKPEGPEHAV